MKPQDFWHIYHAIYPRRWLLAAMLGATLALVAVVCAATPRFYRASAYVMPSETALTKPVIPGAGAAFSTAPRSADRGRLEEQMATLIGLAKTGTVRERAIKSLGLEMSPSDLEQLTTAELGEGNIIRISALAKSPQGAKDLANAIAHQFTAYYRDISSFQARLNRRFLQDEVAGAGAELNQAKDVLQSAKALAGEAALPPGTAENPFLTQFYALRSQIDAARSQLDEVNGRLAGTQREWQAQPETKRTVVGWAPDPGVDAAEVQLQQIERDLAAARAKYTEKHKVITDLLARQAQAEHAVDAARSRTLTRENPLYGLLRDQIPALRAERDALSQKLGALQRAMLENEQRAGRLADSSVILAAKAADYDSAKNRHDQLKQMLEAAVLEERVSSSRGEIQVVDEAKSAAGPVTRGGPSLANLILLGLFLSLGLSFGTVTALAFLDGRVRERQDLQQGLGLPVPAVVPVGVSSDPDRPVARVTELDPTSAHAEAYRYLRTQLLYQKGGTPVRTVLVATAKPAQGGTTTAVNLALALAEVGQRVVLVDSDLRRPGLHHFFGQENDYGLSDLLRGGTDFDRAVRPTDAPTLRLLVAGSQAANPAALLNSAAMGKLLAALRAQADYIIIDGPSLGAFADSMMLGPLVDGVLLVARANQSLGQAEQQAKEMLERVGANIIGAVLNAAPPDRVSNWYYHQHYYGAPAAALRSPTNGGSATTSAGAAPVAPAPAGLVGLLRRHLRNLLLGVLGVGLAAALLIIATHPRHAALPSRARAQAAVQQPALTVVAEVREPTRVRVTQDGELLYEGMLTVGKQTWQADRELEVWAERPEALAMTLNGKDAGLLGTAGSPPLSRVFSTEEGSQQ